MLAALLSLTVGFLILWWVELQYRKKRITNELSRKIIHVLSGIILIIWVFNVSRGAIIFVESLFVLAVIVARKLKILGSQYGVNRLSYGELFFPLGVIAILLMNVAAWLFVVAVSHLAFADTAAALIGMRWGKGSTYYVFGQKKSVVGSFAFLCTSVIILVLARHFVGHGSSDLNAVRFESPHRLLAVPIITTLVENVGVFGSDNLLIPLAVVLLLR